MSLISISNLNFRYNLSGNHIIRNFSAELEKGKIYGISGESGSGKSTLLKLISGIIPEYFNGIVEGIVKLADKPVKEYESFNLGKTLQFVMQEPDHQLFLPTVLDELIFSSENYSFSREQIQQNLNRVLNIFPLQDFLNTYTNKLSYGTKRLVNIASAEMIRPDIIIIDEPFSGLSGKMITLLKKFFLQIKSDNRTVILTDHHIENENICDTVFSPEDFCKE